MHKSALIFGVLLIAHLSQTAGARPPTKTERRVAISTQVIVDRMASMEPIPRQVFEKALCVGSVRNVKAGFVFGGEASWGLVSCRVGKEWSAPSFFSAGGAKLGLLAGGQASNNVLVFMTSKARKLLDGAQIRLGLDLSFAVGPVGSGGSVAIPVADVLTYSYGKGLYAGFSLDGVVMGHAPRFNNEVYGATATPASILVMPGSKAPAVVEPYIKAVTTYDK